MMGSSGRVQFARLIVRMGTPFADHTALFNAVSFCPIIHEMQYGIAGPAIFDAPVATRTLAPATPLKKESVSTDPSSAPLLRMNCKSISSRSPCGVDVVEA